MVLRAPDDGLIEFMLESRSISAELLVNAFTNEREVNRIDHDRGEAHAGIDAALFSKYIFTSWPAEM
ncbi:hypothetical protein [Rhodococcus sp. SMB37]|uniref:hypothetical protein n=1 Tax=Rhodococcus sp. SMB37 TaxID=2512213 RepID=UPI0010475EF9|nr:hypothetical protein [Rhodococcus sp. SMB37]